MFLSLLFIPVFFYFLIGGLLFWAWLDEEKFAWGRLPSRKHCLRFFLLIVFGWLPTIAISYLPIKKNK